MAGKGTWSFTFTSRVPEAISAAEKHTWVAAEIIGGMAESYAKGLAPVDTGNLRNSITHDQEKEGGNTVVIIGSNVEYAPYQELGAPNAHVPAHPYLRPAFENHLSEYRRVYEEELKR